MTIKCSCCNNETEFDIFGVGPHKGLYCKKCGAWIKWANKREIERLHRSDASNAEPLPEYLGDEEQFIFGGIDDVDNV